MFNFLNKFRYCGDDNAPHPKQYRDITFMDRLKFLCFKSKDIIPDNDICIISDHYDIGGWRYVVIGLMDRIIISGIVRRILFDETEQYWLCDHYQNYVSENLVKISAVYLCNGLPKDENELHVNLCNYPIVISDNKIVKDGPWIDALKKYMCDIQIDDKMKSNRDIVDEIIRKNAIRSREEHDVCCAKRKEVMDGWK